MTAERRLATVLFTDIVGSTERAVDLGDSRWRELLRQHHVLVRGELQRFGGRELNMTGDGFLASFEEPERAIRCALAIRDSVRRLGIEIRGGLHAGEVELIERTVGGIAVHTAHRVASLAAPGEVLVSSTVHDFVAGSGFDFEERGTHGLKGIPGEWRLFAVAGAPLRLPASTFWARAREAHLPRVLLIYLVACAAVLWATAFARDALGLPPWILAVAVVLLAIGLIILGATAWVQAHPLTMAHARGEELPGSWEIDLRDVGASMARGRLPHLTWGRSILGGVVAFSLLFGLAGIYVVMKDRGRSFSPKEVQAAAGPAVAVLPFRVVGPGLELWREGMVDLLSTNLDGAAGIRSIAPRTVLASWRETIGERSEPADREALQVARDVGAKYALLGSMVALGGEVRLTAQVHELESGKLLGETQVKGHPDSIPVLVDRLSLEVLRAALAGDAEALPAVDLRRVTTTSLPALKAYLVGEQMFRRSRWDNAIASFTTAVEADSTFALALYRLSLAYGWIQGFSPKVAELSVRAARFAERLPEREAMILRGNAELDHGKLSAIATFERVTTRYPDDAEAWYLLGDAYYHLGAQALHPPSKFVRAFERSLELDPSFGATYIHLVAEQFSEEDSSSAKRLIQRFRQIDSTSADAVAFDVFYALVWGDPASRAAARSALDTLETDELWSPGVITGGAPELWEQRLLVLGALLGERHSREARENAQRSIARMHLTPGHFRQAREALLAAGEEGFGVEAASTFLDWRLVGYTDSSTTRRAAEVLADDSTATSRFLLGALAADEGRWGDVDRELGGLERGAPTGDPSRDSIAAIARPGMARALRGYAAARRGDAAAAINDLGGALKVIPGHCPSPLCNLHGRLRYTMGRVLLDAGRPAEAVRYLSSVKGHWAMSGPAELYLGEAYEALGDLDEARRHYARFVSLWKDADPELRPLLEEGRRALQRLTAVQKL